MWSHRDELLVGFEGGLFVKSSTPLASGHRGDVGCNINAVRHEGQVGARCELSHKLVAAIGSAGHDNRRAFCADHPNEGLSPSFGVVIAKVRRGEVVHGFGTILTKARGSHLGPLAHHGSVNREAKASSDAASRSERFERRVGHVATIMFNNNENSRHLENPQLSE